MKVLIIGSGGREHALYEKIRLSSSCSSVHVAPGNGGIEDKDLIHDLPNIKDTPENFVKYIEKNLYDLVIVGPEDPLAFGIQNILANTCPVFGPSKEAARLEASKKYAKDFMKKYNIPTASSQYFNDFKKAQEYIRQTNAPYVIKADGLAAGKGVSICEKLEEADQCLENLLLREKLGSAGKNLLIEEFMDGEEISVFALCDGNRALLFPPMQDHKRAYEGDKGPNTGGMGSYLPVPIVDQQLINQIQQEIIDKVLAGMKAEGFPYKGLLYAGLMIGKDGQPRVVEFNVRFGDPETQALMCLLEEDLLDLLYSSATSKFSQEKVIAMKKNAAALCVVLAAEGYPGHYLKDIDLCRLDDRVGKSIERLLVFMRELIETLKVF